MIIEPFRLEDGRVHTPMAKAVEHASRNFEQGDAHLCDLAIPLDALTANGRWFCKRGASTADA